MAKSEFKIIAVSVLVTIAAIVVAFGISYAYYRADDNATNQTMTKIKNGTFDFETSLTGNSSINVTNLELIDQSEVEYNAPYLDFTVRSTSDTTNKGKYNVYLKDIVITNNLIASDFKWDLLIDGTVAASGNFGDLTTNGIADTNNTNTSTTSYYSKYYIKEDIAFDGTNTTNLKIRVYLLNNLSTVQNDLLNGSFQCKVAVEGFLRATPPRTAWQPTYYAFGTPTTSSTTDYTTLNKNLFVGLDEAGNKGVCIVRGGQKHCIQTNSYDFEKDNIKQVFSDVTCTEETTYVRCTALDFNCYIESNGRVYCDDRVTYEMCNANYDGTIFCG